MTTLGQKTRVSVPIGTKLGEVVSCYGKQLTMTHRSVAEFKKEEPETRGYWDALHVAWHALNARDSDWLVLKEKDFMAADSSVGRAVTARETNQVAPDCRLPSGACREFDSHPVAAIRLAVCNAGV